MKRISKTGHSKLSHFLICNNPITTLASYQTSYKIATLGPSFHSGPSSLSCLSIDIYLSFQDYSISTIIAIAIALESVFIVAVPSVTLRYNFHSIT